MRTKKTRLKRAAARVLFRLDPDSRFACWQMGRDAAKLAHAFEAWKVPREDIRNPFVWQPARHLWKLGFTGRPYPMPEGQANRDYEQLWSFAWVD